MLESKSIHFFFFLQNVLDVAQKSSIKGCLLAFSKNMCIGYYEDNNVIVFKSGVLAKVHLTTMFLPTSRYML